jgi:hypothetical protein
MDRVLSLLDWGIIISGINVIEQRYALEVWSIFGLPNLPIPMLLPIPIKVIGSFQWTLLS